MATVLRRQRRRAARRLGRRSRSHVRDGAYEWDDSKISSFLSETERSSPDSVKAILSGRVLSPRLHPLIFPDAAEEDPDCLRLRSLSFFGRLLEDDDGGAGRYDALAPAQKQIVGVGVRDLYLAANRGMLADRETEILEDMLKLLSGHEGQTQVGGMHLSFHPSASFRLLKFVRALDARVGDEWSSLFAQVLDTPALFAVFVDPAELSFHNFENIVPLDRWIDSRLDDGEDPAVDLHLDGEEPLGPDQDVLTCKLRGAACDLLKDLASLDLYVPPLNNTTRGGERFIFHSTRLSKALSEAVRASQVLSKLAGGRLTSSFEFVNYVFRANRFKPGHSSFSNHRDTYVIVILYYYYYYSSSSSRAARARRLYPF